LKIPEGVDLRSLPVAGQVLQAAVNQVQGRAINLALVGGSTFMVNDCLGLKASAGQFTLKFGASTFTIDSSGVDLEFVIDEISLTALKVSVKPRVPTWNDPNPCHWSGSFEIGGKARDIRLSAHCEPKISLDDCQLVGLGDFGFHFSIGSLSLEPLPSELDGMAKKLIVDAVNAGLGGPLSDILKEAINSAVLQEICAGKYWIYQAYMASLEAGVTVYSLPQKYVDLLQPF